MRKLLIFPLVNSAYAGVTAVALAGQQYKAGFGEFDGPCAQHPGFTTRRTSGSVDPPAIAGKLWAQIQAAARKGRGKKPMRMSQEVAAATPGLREMQLKPPRFCGGGLMLRSVAFAPLALGFARGTVLVASLYSHSRLVVAMLATTCVFTATAFAQSEQPIHMRSGDLRTPNIPDDSPALQLLKLSMQCTPKGAGIRECMRKPRSLTRGIPGSLVYCVRITNFSKKTGAW